ncbi:IS3 family transposase [Micromonospora aurantiaca (nom. illeg.)]
MISNIYEIWESSGRTYGADRVHRQLRRDGIAWAANASSG